MSREPRFTWSDAWLLHAVAAGGGDGAGATLTDIVANGDLINHALFTPAELRRGFGRLTGVGHVRVDAGRFYLDGAAVDTWRSASRCYSMDQVRKQLQEFLNAEPWPAGDVNSEDPDWPYDLPIEEIVAAEKEYRRRWKLLRGKGKG